MALLPCFTDYITLGVLNNSPRSGLTVEQLPGITSRQVAKLEKFDSLNLTDWYNELYERAVLRLEQDVMEKLSDKFFLDKVVDSQITGEFPEGAFQINDTAQALAGVEINTTDTKYTLTYLNSVIFHTDTIPSPNVITISVFDKVDGRLLEDVVLRDVQVGENELFFGDVKFNTDKLYIAYTTADYTLKKTIFNEQEWHHRWTGTVRQINAGGLIIDYETKCSVQQFICTRLNTFRQALWFAIGIELMMERLTSERTNMFTLSTEKSKELLNEVYLPTYEKRIENTKMKVLDDPICFDCRQAVQSAKLLP